jgi:hypothetical protein
MSFLRRAKDVTADLAAAGKRQAQRGKLEIEVRRLESKVSSEKDALGHALFPLLESGSLRVEIAEVHERMNAIAELLSRLAEKKAELEEFSGEDHREEHPDDSTENIDANATSRASGLQVAKDVAAEELGNPVEEGGQG